MSAAATVEPRLVHSTPGRARIRLEGWSGRGQQTIESRLLRERGVRSVRANPVTGNVLVHFDPAVADEPRLLDALRGPDPVAAADSPRMEEPAPRAVHERRGRTVRARIAVRGLDRDPDLARRVVERLERHAGVRAEANPLTGRVLVEFAEDAAHLGALTAELLELEPPPLPGELMPTDPLERAPVTRSAARVAGAALGLGALGVRRLGGAVGPPVAASGPAVAAGVIGLLEGFPQLRERIRREVGADTADLVFGAAGILSLTLAGGSFGLVLSGLAAARALSEALPRQAAWRRYEERIEDAPSARPGAVIRLEAGEKPPLSATVLEGVGSWIGPDGLPVGVAKGGRVPAGAHLLGGSFLLRLEGGEPFFPEPRPAPVAEPAYDAYVRAITPVSLAYAGLTALVTRSPSRAFAALLLVNARAALLGKEAADAGATARALRSGVTAVGTRPERALRRPGRVLLESPRVLTDGLEAHAAEPHGEGGDAAAMMALAAGVAAAAGSPWGTAFRGIAATPAADGHFDGTVARATSAGIRYSLRPLPSARSLDAATRLRHRGDHLLVLRRADRRRPLAIIALRPRLAPHVGELVRRCTRHEVVLAVAAAGDPAAAHAVAQRAGIPLATGDPVETIRGWQGAGHVVAVVSDSPLAGASFAAADIAVGMTGGRGRFPARADFLAPDLDALACLLAASAHRNAAVRDSVALSALGNAAGVVWGLRGRPDVGSAALVVNTASLAALGAGWLRLRGGERASSPVAHILDPHPERWGRRSIAEVLRAFDSTEAGLTTSQAMDRRRAARPATVRNRLALATIDQLRSPLTGILGAGIGVSLFLGAPADAAMVGAMLLANVAAGVWQELQTEQAADTLERMGTAVGRVLRDGRPVVIPADQIVPGDVLLLARGDRVAADARLISAHGLEVDEATLTGESFPVGKAAADRTGAGSIVLAGSDVILGTAQAVVIGAGRDTRLGATMAALAVEDARRQTPLSTRLHQMLRQVLPIAAAGGGIVAGSGILRGEGTAPQQLALGASVALAAVPEGLPLLAALGEAAVARRLATRNAVVRRPSAVEALGRVDVVCTDKTGTMTEGRLALSLVSDAQEDARPPAAASPRLRHVVLTAALAGPRPDLPEAFTDPTDVVVAEAAVALGFGDELRTPREATSPFDSARSFHASVARGRLCVEGAAEALVPRCSRVRRGDDVHPLDEDGRRALLTHAQGLAERGLRVLMVAEGAPDAPVDDPVGLVALGFLGISDPLRAGVPAAVRRCHAAGVRVIMITGDHPATARAVGREAGLIGGDGEVITGPDLAKLGDAELDEVLARVAVIARATPVDKLRIVESLQRGGHTVAMTGDGVNDAPALRLADVGVAMGSGGTEVARQAADVVLVDDNFATLVETFVEGRTFWHNIRRALGLLLGGNLGELGLEAGASLLGLSSPLTSRQILTMNLMTDVLPALAVVLQQPEHHDLAALSREGTSALGVPLRNEILARGAATALPSLATYLIALRAGGVPLARTIAFANIVATQLAQTLDVGRGGGSPARSIRRIVAGTAGSLVAMLTLPPLRRFFGLVAPTPLGWALVAAGAGTSIALGRVLAPRIGAADDLPERGGARGRGAEL